MWGNKGLLKSLLFVSIGAWHISHFSEAGL